MKSAVVPAQVTTVEDKIAGNISLFQLLLLIIPVISSGILYLLFPPFFRVSLYKLILATLIGCVSAASAIRFKGKVIFWWAILLARYNLRARYYVFNKNDLALRSVEENIESTEIEPEKVISKPAPVTGPVISQLDMVQVAEFVASPETTLAFKPGKKGDMNVFITKIK